MDCMGCKDNYLRRLFTKCMIVCGSDTHKALALFIDECVKLGDTRTSLSIVNAMIDGPDNCDVCKRYRELYVKREVT